MLNKSRKLALLSCVSTLHINASIVTSFDNFLQSTFLSFALQKIVVTPKLSINQSTERSWVNWVTYLFYSFKYQLWQYKIFYHLI